MYDLVSPEKIQLPAGAVIRLPATWQEYEQLCEQRGKGSIVTMTLPEESGIEPDYCFYIDHWEAVSGKKRIDWRTDPPPDLVIEVDVTSYSDVQD